jgi:TPP-dependent pyruvate/acetoin dehydrogenase alpha subunit
VNLAGEGKFANPGSRELMARYETMLKIRRFEERAIGLFKDGELPGFIHSSVGQEGVAAGVMGALREDDYITSTHRGHGHIIAKGGELGPMMAELMGKRTGYCKGKGGSMHIFSLGLGVLGANGILGAGQPIAVGAALSARLRGTDQVVATFFGEGASAQGAVHEAMNLAVIWSLPVVFVCEVNGFAELTPYEAHVSVPSMVERAAGYGIPATSVDGTDVISVQQVTEEAVERARGGSPSLVEARTVRWRGHYEGDPQGYRSPEELAATADRDPIRFLEDRMRHSGTAEKELEAVRERVRAQVEDAVEFARSSPLPEAGEELEDVYA